MLSSKIAIKMSRASGKGKEALDGKDETSVSVSSDSEEEEVEGTGREETPDLYRNSALGM
jgi:E3 ubiquitin-protein ligase HUWE1